MVVVDFFGLKTTKNMEGFTLNITSKENKKTLAKKMAEGYEKCGGMNLKIANESFLAEEVDFTKKESQLKNYENT